MQRLLLSLKSFGYNLRTLGYGLCINFIKSQLRKKTFINRAILMIVIKSLYCFYYVEYFLYRY